MPMMMIMTIMRMVLMMMMMMRMMMVLMMMMMTMKNQSTNEEGAKNFPLFLFLRLLWPMIDPSIYLYTSVFMRMMTTMMMTI